ncbi:IS200/IS605 family transposase [Larkinella arboricola]
MANTYTQLYVQVVFAVKDRQSLIPHRHKEELHCYITGIVQRRGAKLLAVHCMPDHTHLFVSYSPALAIADLVKEVKTATSTFIKDKRSTRVPFYWQEGYGAFSYSQSQVDAVVRYILNQEEHHHKRTFRDEYRALLEKFEIPFETKYLFKWVEEEG